MQRIIGVLLLAGLLAVPIFFLYGLEESDLQKRPLEYIVRDRFPFHQQLRQTALELRLFGGQREQNGIFISENRLMKKIDPPDDTYTRKNTEAISSFTSYLAKNSNGKNHTYLALIPTAAGVLQQELPKFAGSGTLNQRRKIEQIYNELSVDVRTVDVYSTLLNQQDQYIYHRTDHSLAARGGYHVYTAIVSRMGIISRTLSHFDIEYVDQSFYGNLYQPSTSRTIVQESTTAPYRKVPADVLTLFRYERDRKYIVTQQDGDERRIYHTLYPEHCMELGSPLDIYLGGPAALTKIKSSAFYSSQLLVFGDDTANVFLPFLANHYSQIQLVNVLRASDEELAAISLDEYSQVLFAYSIENFIHSDAPARIGQLLPKNA